MVANPDDTEAQQRMDARSGRAVLPVIAWEGAITGDHVSGAGKNAGGEPAVTKENLKRHQIIKMLWTLGFEPGKFLFFWGGN